MNKVDANILFIDVFVNFWAHWVFAAAHGHCEALARGGFLSSFSSRACGHGFSGCGAKAPESQGMGGLGRPMACGIPDHWSNLCALQWQGHA